MSSKEQETSSYNRIVNMLIKHPRYKYRDSFLQGLSQTDNGIVASFTFWVNYKPGIRLKTSVICKLTDPEVERFKTSTPESYFPRPQGRNSCLIYLHTHHGCRAEGTYLVNFLSQYEAALVLFDFAGTGESEGEYTSFGEYESDQTNSVVAFMVNNLGFNNIGIWGKSMGGCAGVLYQGKTNHPAVKFLVTDSSFDKLKHAVVSIAKQHSSAPTFAIKAFMYFVCQTVKKKAGFDVYRVRPIDWVTKIRIPVVFVKGKEDNVVTPTEFESLYINCPSTQKHLKITEGNHTGNRLDDHHFKTFITSFIGNFFPQAIPQSSQSKAFMNSRAGASRGFDMSRMGLSLKQGSHGSDHLSMSSEGDIHMMHKSNFGEASRMMNPDTGMIQVEEDSDSQSYSGGRPSTLPEPQDQHRYDFMSPQAQPNLGFWNNENKDYHHSNTDMNTYGREGDYIETKPRSITFQHQIGSPMSDQPIISRATTGTYTPYHHNTTKNPLLGSPFSLNKSRKSLVEEKRENFIIPSTQPPRQSYNNHHNPPQKEPYVNPPIKKNSPVNFISHIHPSPSNLHHPPQARHPPQPPKPYTYHDTQLATTDSYLEPITNLDRLPVFDSMILPEESPPQDFSPPAYPDYQHYNEAPQPTHHYTYDRNSAPAQYHYDRSSLHTPTHYQQAQPILSYDTPQVDYNYYQHPHSENTQHHHYQHSHAHHGQGTYSMDR